MKSVGNKEIIYPAMGIGVDGGYRGENNGGRLVMIFPWDLEAMMEIIIIMMLKNLIRK